MAMSWQPHSVVPGICRHAWLVGQSPPHCGAVPWLHWTGGCTQSHRPAVFGLQARPAGQSPPHPGNVLWPQASGAPTQSH
jgi:hypothetical protein